MGRKRHVIFDLVEQNDAYPTRIVNTDGRLLLTAFEPGTKRNGFWWTDANGSDPIKCNMEDCSYLISRTNALGSSDGANGETPVKARDFNRYIVSRSRVDDFPNFYVTDDFVTFRAMSDLHPEKQYNWLTAELVTWKMTDGRMFAGQFIQA